MSLGSYPMVSLLEARQKRDSNKQLLSQSINPARVQSKIDTTKSTFQEMFEQWIENKISAFGQFYENYEMLLFFMLIQLELL